MDESAPGDGFFWLVTDLTGEREFTAAAEGYTPRSTTVRLEPDAVTEIGFALSRS